VIEWAKVNQLKMSQRPKRSVSTVNYTELADVKVPTVKKQKRKVMKRTEEPDDRQSTLYRLSIVEENRQEGLVKVRYVGYGEEYDEWRLKSEIVNLSSEEEGSSCDSDEPVQFTRNFRGPLQSQCSVSQFEELAYRIKALLTSSRKGDPSCRIIMPFDQVSFDALALRCSLVNRNPKCKRQVYKIHDLAKLNDLLGDRWHIRGLNAAGDFCYVMHDTMKLYMKQSQGRPDYQLLDDGTMVKTYFGRQKQLVVFFIRGDGVASQWNDIVKTGRR